ncbi:hypothetical protein VC83_06586 [Pseudogymnoascus destructans]|uniref:Uncharacterized protein n=1 Tax=Pseudogymnoascus destructans TaxID=655981 RepID=A0A177A7U5_9PEZI|nr:uncharacterized protein VC83_06586 [Pseudogymnoascus destructans]OAF58216.1 hypothetical protein VC83_06586 [Pseudogymnoascus destructans]
MPLSFFRSGGLSAHVGSHHRAKVAKGDNSEVKRTLHGIIAPTRQDEVIETLLSAGANVNTMGAKGQTPLFAAIMTRNKKVLQRFMGMGAILNPRAAYATACSRVHGVSGDALITAIAQGDSDVVNCLLK